MQPHIRNRLRKAAIALAIFLLFTVGYPVAVDQGLLRYNPYVLPIVGLVAVLLCIVWFLHTDFAFKHFGQFALKRGVMALFIFLIFGALSGVVIAAGYFWILNLSKTHIAALLAHDKASSDGISKTPAATEQPPTNNGTHGTTNKAEAGAKVEAPCRVESGRLIDCSGSEVLEWGKPVLARLNAEIKVNKDSMGRRHEQYQKDHDEAALNNKLPENVRLNRYLEGDYKNLVIYRAALVSKLKGGDPTGGDPMQAAFGRSVVGGELGLLDKDSHLTDAEMVFRNLQELSRKLSDQLAQRYPQRQQETTNKEIIDYSPATLQAMSPSSLILTTQTLASRLRELDKEMDTAYNANNEEWQRKDKEAKSKEQKEVIGSERMDKNQRMVENYSQRFRDEFLRDTQSLQTELVRRASTLRIRGPLTVPMNPGTRIGPPTLPPVPRALQQGDVMTFGELSKVADYLIELAKLI